MATTEVATKTNTAKLVQSAALNSELMSKRGMLEWLFSQMFKGMVYPQIWEDPEVDMEALQLTPESRIITIASGGCNVLNYLTEGPDKIIAVDLSPAHVALTKLKIASLRHLPDYEDFFQFFGKADEKANKRAFFNHVAPHLDSATFKYWNGRGLRGKRINLFTKNFYRHGVLGRYIRLLHMLTRIHGQDLRPILEVKDEQERRALFESTYAPIFDSKLLRMLAKMPVSLYGLGIPPSQFEALLSDSNGNLNALLRERVERLACDFDIEDNYFAWQAFGMSYDQKNRTAVPRYLMEHHYEPLRSTLDRIEVHQTTFTSYLNQQPDNSMDRYVLLDAQDWMTDEQLAALWSEIIRTSRPGGRVIFRTAGTESILPGRLPPEILNCFDYDENYSRELFLKDSSSIYGGFHLYILKG